MDMTVGFMCHTWLDNNIQLFTQTLACMLLQRHFVNEIKVHNQPTFEQGRLSSMIWVGLIPSFARPESRLKFPG